MTNQTETRRCQWKDCDSASTKHVMYNYQPHGEMTSNMRGATIGFSITHADLCDPHEAELRTLYGDVHVKEDRCSDDCPSRL